MGHLGYPSPPISMMPKWRVFAPSPLHNCFGRGGGESGPPLPPISMMPNWRVFAPLLWGGRGLIVPFYSVQDCSSPRSRYVGFVFQCDLCFFSVICVTRRVCFFKKIQDFPKEMHPYRDFLRTIFGLKIGYCPPHPPVPN